MGRTGRRRRSGRRRWLVLAVLFALAAGAAALLLFPRDPERARRAALVRAWEAVDSRDYAAALVLLDRYLAEHGEHPHARNLRAVALLGLGRVEEGEDSARKALALDPEHTDAKVTLARCRLARGDPAGALETAREVLRSRPGNAPAHLVMAAVLLRRPWRNPSQAAGHLEKAVEAGVDDLDTLTLLAELTAEGPGADPKAAAARIDLARRKAGERLRAGGRAGPVHLLLARLALSAGEPEEALRQIDESGDSGEAAALLRARACAAAGRAEEADRVVDGILEGEPPAETLADLADRYLGAGRIDRARAVMARARELHPDSLPVALEMIRLDLLGRDAAGAVARARAALRGRPGDPRLSAALAEALLAEGGDRTEAEALLRASAADAETAPTATLRLAELLLDTSADDAGLDARLREAEEILAAAAPGAAAEGTGPWVGYLRGKLDLRRGRPDRARETLRTVVSAATADVRPRLLLAEACRRTGDREGEAAAVTSAMEIAGETPPLLLARAEAYLALGRALPAAADARRALAALPGRPEPLVLLGRALLEREEPRREEGLEALRRAVALPDAGTGALVALGRALFAGGDVDEGRATLRRAFDEARTEEDALLAGFDLARAADLAAGRILSEEGLGVREALVERFPQCVAARTSLGGLFLETGRLDRAEELARAAVGLSPDAPGALRLLFDVLCEREGEEAVAERERIGPRIEEAEAGGPVALYVAGRRALAAGDAAAAADLLSRAAAGAPGDAGIALHLALSRFREGDLDEAERILTRLSSRSPDAIRARGLLGRIGIERGHRLLSGGNALAAAEELERVAATLGTPEPGRPLLAGALFEAGLDGSREHLDRARREAEAWVASLPEERAEELGSALLLLGDVCRALGDRPAFLAACERHVRVAPDSATAWLRWSFALMAADRGEEARVAAARASALAPASLLAARHECGVLILTGRAAEAAKRAEAFAAASPEDAAARNLLGLALFAAGRKAEAEATLRLSLEKDPGDLAAADALARFLVSDGRGEDAVAALRALLDRTGRRGEVAFLLGRTCLAAAPEAADGFNWLLQARRLRVTSPIHRVECEILLLAWLAERGRWGDVVRAATEFEQSAGTEAELGRRGAARARSAEIWFQQALGEQLLGRPDPAIASLRRALDRNPRHPGARNNLAYLLSAREADREEAEALARSVVADSPGVPEFEDTLGEVLLRRGKVEEAIRTLEAAVASFERRAAAGGKVLGTGRPERVGAETLVRLGTARLAAGDREGAARELAKARAADPSVEDSAEYREARRRAEER